MMGHDFLQFQFGRRKSKKPHEYRGAFRKHPSDNPINRQVDMLNTL